MLATASIVLALALLAVTVNAQSVIPPGKYASLTIPKGTTRRLAGKYKIDRLTIAGTLLCGSSATVHPDISLTSVNIQVKGAFTCGTRAAPYKGRVTITMTGNGAEGTKLVDVTGSITMTGRPRATWTSITSTISPGDKTFTTASAVDWRAGERIVVTSTDFSPDNKEEAIIASVAALPRGGSRVTVRTAFQVTHYGDLQTYRNGKGSSWVLDERAQVALLERNIVFQGDGDDIGAIITIRNGGNGYAQNVKFDKVGQKGRLGTYPWHWHMLGNRKGNYFRNNVVMRSTNRCVTVHGTDNVLVERNVCYDNIGHGYFIEDGCEEGNTFRYNLGLSTKRPASLRAGPIDTDTTHLSTFWITNPNNYFYGNVAAGSEMAGFWFMLPDTPTRECFTKKVKPGLVPNQRPLGAFDNNVAHSNFVGVGIEGGIKNTDRAPSTGVVDVWDPPTYPRMNNNTIYKNTNGQRSLWVTMAKTIYFDNTKLADNGGNSLFSGAQILRNSLIVGESANIFTNRRGSVTFGFGLYDGPAGLVNVHFAGFPRWYQYAIPVTGAGTKSWNFYMQDVTFDESVGKKLVLRGNLTQSEMFSQGIIDKTGSLTGEPNTLMLWPLGTAGLKAPSRNSPDFNVPRGKCTFSASLGTYVCPASVQLGTMIFLHRFKARHQLLDVARSDNKYATVDSSGRGQYQFNVILDTRLTYTATFRNRNSLLFVGGKPQYFEILFRNVDPGKSVQLTLRNLPTSPAWKWAVTECYSHRKLVTATPKSSLTFRVTAGKPRVRMPAPVYPNQKVGTVRIKVCAHPTGACPC